MKMYVWPDAKLGFFRGSVAVLASSKQEAIDAVLKVHNDTQNFLADSECEVYELGEVLSLEMDW